MNAGSSKAVTEADRCSAGKSGEVLAVDVAAAKALRAATSIRETERIPLIDAAGRISAAAVSSALNLPPFDNSAMDGYAVRTADFTGEGPWRLKVAGRVAAGQCDPAPSAKGAAIRIFTGAPVPAGCDAVVIQEACQRSGDVVTISVRPVPGRNIRLTGEDVAVGGCVVEAGDHLTPPRLAILAATGCASVNVKRPIRVGLISTGSELVEPGTPLCAGMIYNSNRYFLRAALNHPWIEIRDFGIVPDNADTIRTLVREASASCDVLITTGGVSAGDEDHMLDVLRRENAELEVLKVAMRPGKPVTVGRIGGTLYFGLPGNPYAAAITFSRIAWPAIKLTGGMQPALPSWTPAISGFRYSRKTGRTEYVPVTWNRRDEFGRPIVEMLGRGSSASLSPMAAAKAIAILPPDLAVVETGAPLHIEALCE